MPTNKPIHHKANTQISYSSLSLLLETDMLSFISFKFISTYILPFRIGKNARFLCEMTLNPCGTYGCRSGHLHTFFSQNVCKSLLHPWKHRADIGLVQSFLNLIDLPNIRLTHIHSVRSHL